MNIEMMAHSYRLMFDDVVKWISYWIESPMDSTIQLIQRIFKQSKREKNGDCKQTTNIKIRHTHKNTDNLARSYSGKISQKSISN